MLYSVLEKLAKYIFLKNIAILSFFQGFEETGNYLIELKFIWTVKITYYFYVKASDFIGRRRKDQL
jgi:hypothetical protein